MKRIIGGAKPTKKDYFKAAKSSYQPKATKNIDGFVNVFDGRTLDAFVNEDDKEILVGIRGTADKGDVKSWHKIASADLEGSDIAKEDIRQFKEIVSKYPPKQYKYRLSGHSLGGAMTALLIRKFPFIKEGQVFNAAVETSELRNPSKKIKYNYIDKDPLYNLEGRLLKTKNKKVYKYHDMGKSEGFLDKLKPDFLKAHSLEQFKKYVETTPAMEGIAINQDLDLDKVGGAQDPSKKMPAPKDPVYGSDVDREDDPYLDMLRFYLKEAYDDYVERYDSMKDFERISAKEDLERMQNAIDAYISRRSRRGAGLAGGRQIPEIDNDEEEDDMYINIDQIEHDPQYVRMKRMLDQTIERFNEEYDDLTELERIHNRKYIEGIKNWIAGYLERTFTHQPRNMEGSGLDHHYSMCRNEFSSGVLYSGINDMI